MIEPCTLTLTVRLKTGQETLEPFLRAFFVQDKPWSVKIDGVRVVSVSDHSGDPETPHVEVGIEADDMEIET